MDPKSGPKVLPSARILLVDLHFLAARLSKIMQIG